MKKKILTDVGLNIIASFIPIFILQFVILPKVASGMNSDSYGQLLSIVSIINISALSFGTALNNSRLINFKQYSNLDSNGDYNIIFVIYTIINILVVIAGLIFYGESLNYMAQVLVVATSVLMVFKTYASVEFRIKLNYRHILVSGIILFLGYLIGYAVYVITGYWIFIYLFGFLFASVYIKINTKISKESFNKSFMFKDTLVKTSYLLGSGILISLVTYVDKLIVFPMAGGHAVSIYYIATILGKTIVLIIGPITSVMLSYFAQMKSFSNHYFKWLLTISSILGLLGYVFVMILSEPLLTVIYPQYFEECVRYIPITTLSVIITIIGDIINSVILKFRGAKLQVHINLVYVSLYIFLGFVLLYSFGLMGFCASVLITAIIRLLLLVFAYYHKMDK